MIPNYQEPKNPKETTIKSNKKIYKKNKRKINNKKKDKKKREKIKRKEGKEKIGNITFNI
jgi:hypothetical protein